MQVGVANLVAELNNERLSVLGDSLAMEVVDGFGPTFCSHVLRDTILS